MPKKLRDEKTKKQAGDYSKFMDFEDYAWFDERQAEVDKQVQNYDPTKDITLKPRWQGKYKGRFLPIKDRRDWMVPVGVHYNVWETSDENEFVMVPCPRILLGRSCPICEARDWAITRGIVSRDDPIFKGNKEGKGGMKLDVGFLSRFLLTDFIPGEREKKPPKFEGFPLIRIFKFPKAVRNTVDGYMKDPDVGFQKILGLETGVEWTFEKSELIVPYWWKATPLLDKPYPLPMMILDKWEDVEAEFNINELIPDVSTDQVLALLEKHQNNLPEFMTEFLSGDRTVERLEASELRKRLTV